MSGPLPSILGGGGGAQIGSLIQADYAPNYFNQNGQEFLRSGNIIAYSASYSVARDQGYGVWGNDAAQISATLTSTAGVIYSYLAGKYVAFPQGSSLTYSADLITWTNCTTPPAAQPVYSAPYWYQGMVANNGTYIVAANQTANTGPKYTADAITWSTPGGTFTTFPASYACGFGNNIWVSLASLIGAAGEQGYIANANPSGAWTVGAGANIGMTTCLGLAYGNGVFVAVGGGAAATATAGQIATCTTPAGGWTDRTSGSGLTLAAGSWVANPIFDGTYFWAQQYTAGVPSLIRSSNGQAWTKVALPAGILSAYGMTTDGAGRLILTSSAAAGSSNYARWASTTDGGATWSTGQFYVGKMARNPSLGVVAVSYANNQCLIGQSGDHRNSLALGTLPVATPNYIGAQAAVGFGPATSGGLLPYATAHVRIK